MTKFLTLAVAKAWTNAKPHVAVGVETHIDINSLKGFIMLNLQQCLTAIREQLEILQPDRLQVINESKNHVTNTGAQNSAGHYAIVIRSGKFRNRSLVDCYSMIYSALGDLMEKEIHTLRIKIERE